MNSKPLIELSAIAGKIAIDQTKLHPLAKEAIKWTIDQVREILKNGNGLEIENICNAAERYGVYKVIAIPFPMLNGQNIVYIKAYGGNPTAFFNRLGMQIIPENTVNDNLSFIPELETKLGIVIYEKK
jgi:hypothetical protein